MYYLIVYCYANINTFGPKIEKIISIKQFSQIDNIKLNERVTQNIDGLKIKREYLILNGDQEKGSAVSPITLSLLTVGCMDICCCNTRYSYQLAAFCAVFLHAKRVFDK